MNIVQVITELAPMVSAGHIEFDANAEEVIVRILLDDVKLPNVETVFRNGQNWTYRFPDKFEGSFWANNHALTPLSNELHEKFIPMLGATEYVESEVLRAMNKLHHDYFNNGFGNNMSQPIAYISKYYYLTEASEKFKQSFDRIAEAATEPWNQDTVDDDFNIALSEVVLWLSDRDNKQQLNTLVEEMYAMPYREIEWPNETDDEDDWLDTYGDGDLNG